MDDADTQMTTSIVSQIPGGQQLIDWFHGYLEFGDAEVVELRLVRGEPSVLRIWQSISQRGRSSGAPFKAAQISFTVRDVFEVAIQGFSHQNVIGGLKIRTAPPVEVHPSLMGVGVNLPDHEIELEPCAGAFGIIRATIEAIAIEPTATR